MSGLDLLIEWICALLLVALWVYIVLNYTHLPESIPSHFDASGKTDGFESKSIIFMQPVITSIIYLIITILNRYPHTFNYLNPITAENALQQYTYATRTLRYLKLIVVSIFSFIEYQVVRTATSEVDGLGAWFLPITVVMLFIPIIYALLKAKKVKA